MIYIEESNETIVDELTKEIKEEALERMKLLELHPNIINDFKIENKLNRSETSLGLLYWLTEEEQDLVTEFEKTHMRYLVYHVIKTVTTNFGVVYDLLYVAPYKEDWLLDRENLKEDLVMSYSVTPFPESGLIQINRVNGGLVRTY